MTEPLSPAPPAARLPVTVEIPLAWGEMDAFGHVNNMVFFRWFETARIEWLRRVGWMGDGPASTGPASAGIGVILHSVQARFRIPVVYPDTLDVAARLLSIADDRLTLAHEVKSRANGGAVAAEGWGIVVAFDYSTRTKAAIPAQVRARIAELGLGISTRAP